VFQRVADCQGADSLVPIHNPLAPICCSVAMGWSVFQCVAGCCRVLQCVAVC